MRKKVIAIGSTGSGKTSFFSRLRGRAFREHCQPTIAADGPLFDQSSEIRDLPEDEHYLLLCDQRSEIWDLSGDKRYLDLQRGLYYKNAAIALLFVDASDYQNSIDELKPKLAGISRDTQFAVIFTKADLVSADFSPAEVYCQLKDKLNIAEERFVMSMPYGVTSAKADMQDCLQLNIKGLLEADSEKLQQSELIANIRASLLSMETTEKKKQAFSRCNSLKELCFSAVTQPQDGRFHFTNTTKEGEQLLKLLNLPENRLLALQVRPSGNNVRFQDLQAYALNQGEPEARWFGLKTDQDKRNEDFFSHQAASSLLFKSRFEQASGLEHDSVEFSIN